MPQCVSADVCGWGRQEKNDIMVREEKKKKKDKLDDVQRCFSPPLWKECLLLLLSWGKISGGQCLYQHCRRQI